MRSSMCACIRVIVRALRVERDALRRGSMFLISGRPVARTRYYRDTPTRVRLGPYGDSSFRSSARPRNITLVKVGERKARNIHSGL